MPHRYFTTEISDGTATLRGADAHHLARVMRARLGDTVILCDGNAVEYTATITGFGDECVEFRVEPGYPSAAEPSVEVTLLAGYPKQDKLEQIIKHGVELGAAHIVPFFSRYCVAAPKKEEQKNERYNRIAVEAAKQCGRGVLPDVALPLANFGAVCRTFAQYDLVLFCYECGGAPLRDLLAAAKPADGEKLKIAIVTGAEGGFAAEEAEMAAKAGARTVGLGPRILRCETAPLGRRRADQSMRPLSFAFCQVRQTRSLLTGKHGWNLLLSSSNFISSCSTIQCAAFWASVSAASMSAYRSSSVMFCGSGLPARSQTSSASSMRSDGRGRPCMFIIR